MLFDRIIVSTSAKEVMRRLQDLGNGFLAELECTRRRQNMRVP
jgi:hypothetical protein